MNNLKRLKTPPEDDMYEDVGDNFRFGFQVVFFSSIIQALGWYLNHIYFEDKTKRAYAFYCLAIPALIMGLYTILWLMKVRF